MTARRQKAANQQGSIKPRVLKNGTTVFDAWAPPVTDPVTGQGHRPAKRGLRSHDAAVRFIADEVSKADMGRRAKERGFKVGQVKEMMLAASADKRSSTGSYWWRYEHYIKMYLDDEWIARVMPMHVEAWVKALKNRGLDGRTIAGAASVLSQIMEFAIHNGLGRSSNPVLATDAVKKVRKSGRSKSETARKVVWTPHQLTTFLAAEKYEHWLALWVFIVATGCRRGEACAVRWIDIDFEESLVTFRKNRTRDQRTREWYTEDSPKGGRPRPVPLDKTTLEVLQVQRERLKVWREANKRWMHDLDLVFPRTHIRLRAGQVAGGYQDPDNVWTNFTEKYRRLGLPAIEGIHALRHTWASIAHDHGVDDRLIQSILGHSAMETTFIYIHKTEAQQRAAVKTVASTFLKLPD